MLRWGRAANKESLGVATSSWTLRPLSRSFLMWPGPSSLEALQIPCKLTLSVVEYQAMSPPRSLSVLDGVRPAQTDRRSPTSASQQPWVVRSQTAVPGLSNEERAENSRSSKGGVPLLSTSGEVMERDRSGRRSRGAWLGCKLGAGRIVNGGGILRIDGTRHRFAI
jgi:hypothetical protein